jgi:hypothetical protein
MPKDHKNIFPAAPVDPRSSTRIMLQTERRAAMHDVPGETHWHEPKAGENADALSPISSVSRVAGACFSHE